MTLSAVPHCGMFLASKQYFSYVGMGSDGSFFQELLRTILSFHFQYTEQFVVAMLPVAISVISRAQGMAMAGRFNKKFARR